MRERLLIILSIVAFTVAVMAERNALLPITSSSLSSQTLGMFPPPLVPVPPSLPCRPNSPVPDDEFNREQCALAVITAYEYVIAINGFIIRQIADCPYNTTHPVPPFATACQNSLENMQFYSDKARAATDYLLKWCK